MKIYFLQIICDFTDEKHYEGVYATKEKAIEVGKEMLEKLMREHYEEMFEEDKKDKIPNLTHKVLFNLQAIYDFSITEYDPEYYDSFDDISKLPIVENLDAHYTFLADLEPVKIIHSYDDLGKECYISAIYLFNYKGKRKEKKVMMNYEDYINPNAGTKFQKGDIVRINRKNSHWNYHFDDKLHIVTDVPQRKANQKFFKNNYGVIVNHNEFDEGCHVDIFDEDELEIYDGKLPKDSPILFLSKFVKGEIKLSDVLWTDLECGNITLNENKSFRDIPEIREKLGIDED